MTEEKQRNFHENWWWRRLIYVIIAVAGVILTGFGMVDAGSFDAAEASPLLGTVVGVLAALFTGTGSDSRAKDSELDAARLDRQEFQDSVAALQSQIQDQVQGAVSGAVDLLPDRVQEAVRSIYDAPYGRHEQVAAPEPDGSGPSRYPGA